MTTISAKLQGCEWTGVLYIRSVVFLVAANLTVPGDTAERNASSESKPKQPTTDLDSLGKTNVMI